ncbi:T9SS type A sorting domain-containing protein [Anditalea andensis]|uniref:T9SS type A sorting domain-containing protein n=1 Tax=Anditalea andensis TaxID=1048983 RepID=UPI00373FE391
MEDGTTFEESEVYEIKLFDERGKEVLYQKTDQDKTTIPLTNLNKSYYNLHIIETDGVIRKKIQVNR